MIFYERHRRSSEICCRMDMHIKAKCHPCWIFVGYGYVLPSQIINYWYQTPTSQAATLPTSGYIAAISTVYFVAPGKAVVFRCMPSAAPKSSWCLLEMSLSAHKGGRSGDQQNDRYAKGRNGLPRNQWGCTKLCGQSHQSTANNHLGRQWRRQLLRNARDIQNKTHARRGGQASQKSSTVNQVPSAPCDSHYNTITSTSFDMTNNQCWCIP